MIENNLEVIKKELNMAVTLEEITISRANFIKMIKLKVTNIIVSSQLKEVGSGQINNNSKIKINKIQATITLVVVMKVMMKYKILKKAKKVNGEISH